MIPDSDLILKKNQTVCTKLNISRGKSEIYLWHDGLGRFITEDFGKHEGFDHSKITLKKNPYKKYDYG